MESSSIFAMFILTLTFGGIQMQGHFIDFVSNEEPFECTRAGYQCNGCNESYYCIPVGDGYLPQLVEVCADNGKTCLETSGQCTAGENLPCDKGVTDYEFTCHQPGMFPHPFQCDKFYICQEPLQKPNSKQCPAGYMYDPLTTLCNKKTGTCNPPGKTCHTIGEMKGVEGHPSMYYICLFQSTRDLLTPQMVLCPKDELFIDSKCVAPETGLDSNGKCIKSGVFYIPSDCKMYKECSSTGANPVNKTCACGSKFYPGKGKCDLTTC